MNRLETSVYSFIAVLTAFTIAACGSNTPDPESPDASAIEVGTSQPGEPSGIVVVNSDYQASSVSLLDRNGNLLKDGCFNSGSGANGLSLTLSGDVVLPTQLPLGGAVVVIDRGYAVLTWLDPTTCAPLGQLAVGTGYAAYPHDLVVLSASKAYVTRYEVNAAATPAPGDFDDGGDLLIVDPSQAKIVGRIDLVPFAPAGTNIQPRADRALLVDGMVYVSLNAISGDFKNYGTGRIVVVDPTSDQVAGTIDIPNAKNCGAMTYLAAEKKLLVACAGAYSDGPQQFASSAIVAIDLGATTMTVVTQINASDVSGLPFSNGGMAALNGNSVLGVTLGDFSNIPPDQMWSVSLAGGQPSKVFTSTEAFALGAVLADVKNGRIFVADGTTNSSAFVRAFAFASGGFVATKAIDADPSHHLPPRALAWY
jgi:hypothetical protein